MKRAYKLFLLLQGLQLVLVFVCGPHSCEWGNEVYFYFGVVALVLSFLIPLWQKGWPLRKQIGAGFLFLLGSVALWCAGFLLGEFRLMCRLF